MKNNKGVTLATVVVTIIVMLVIATVSIVAGNKLIVSSNEYDEGQEYESVVSAVKRKKTEVNLAGSLIPVGEAYVGVVDPIIKSDSTGSLKADGWYLLDEVALEKLGLNELSSRYLVNYDYEVVLSTKNSDYVEECLVAEYIHNVSEKGRCGLQLKDKVSGDTNVMIQIEDTSELFGTGWYLVNPSDYNPEELPKHLRDYVSYIENPYLINYDRYEYVKLDMDYKKI